ncbi:hypothetical protein [Massilia sp. NR 4-1]|uniref:hypothetical protein n=1 Tax=Massilia sp. NR 4-1 TaxID=1678028 RepID=UPI00067D29AA|nr:hypothetical protein [Massilia sp. NR 4-1]AKU21020.1 hypothetical protein ACZ75_05480 [Massilia sp. NR 4-1]
MQVQNNFFAKRRFLKIALLGLGGTVAAATGGAAYLTMTHRHRDRYGKLLVLDDHCADIVHALAEASVPVGVAFPTIEQAEVLTRFDEELFFVNEGIGSDLRSAFYLLEFLPLAKGYASRFSRLPVAARRKFLAEACDTRDDTVRAVIFNLPATMRWYYYGHPSSWKAIGYDGPFMNLPEKRSEQRVLYAKLSGRTPRA